MRPTFRTWLHRVMGNGTTKRSTAKRPAVRLVMEMLEDRSLPSVTLLSSGELLISGTSGDDQFRVEGNGQFIKVTEGASTSPTGGTAISFPSKKVTKITIDGTGTINSRMPMNFRQGGNDKIDVESVVAFAPVEIHLGAGFSQVYLGWNVNSLSYLIGSPRVNIFDDSMVSDGCHLDLYTSDLAVTTGTTYTLNDTSLTRGGAPPIYYPPTTHLHILAAPGGNIINVEQTPRADPAFPGQVLDLYPGATDTINLGSPSSTTGQSFWLDGDVAVNGGGLLNIYDQQGSTGTYSIDGWGITLDRTFQISLAPGLRTELFGAFSQSGTDYHVSGGLSGHGFLSGPVNIVAQGPNNHLDVILNDGNVWNITGADTGTVNTVSGLAWNLNGPVGFFNMQHLGVGRQDLTGAAPPDRFVFSDQARIDSIGVDSRAAISLDFSAYTSPLTANLPAGTVTSVDAVGTNFTVIGQLSATVKEVIGGARADRIIGDGTANQVLRGGPGDDFLQAGANSAVLVGGTGNDTLLGGAGRNILIGGDGSDRLTGGPGDDILISGDLTYDGNDAALLAVLAEWADPTKSAATRQSDLAAGVGPGGAFALNASTIVHDSWVDTLVSSGGNDWYWSDPWVYARINGRLVILAAGDMMVTN
ncbi:hypothetical protein AYO44_08735 [Planctomycetaceae bacterium SCGC AG-212-F19]|nr:hypothetical protein AYO44_08735 [Planctomycetaceae bacterium SCGC AG-212-F19]